MITSLLLEVESCLQLLLLGIMTVFFGCLSYNVFETEIDLPVSVVIFFLMFMLLLYNVNYFSSVLSSLFAVVKQASSVTLFPCDR